MDIKGMNTGFSVEQLMTGKLNKEQFKVNFLPMWQFLDNWERKVGGFDNVQIKDIFEGIYEYAIVSVSLDKADMQTRIDNLTEQNIKWYTKATDLEKENERLRQQLLEKQSSNAN